MSTTMATPRHTVPVPILNLPAAFEAQREELLAEIAGIAASGQYVLGAKVQTFESALAAYCGARFALGMSSGTDAQLAGLMAMGIGPGDEVIVPAFTFFATAGCVARLGATPVFCDVDPTTYNIDVLDAARRITTRTKAIAAVHLYGQMADMPALLELGRERNLPILEDAAQAIGANAQGVGSAGAIGHFGWLSFYPTKNLGAMGDAGALLTNDESFMQRCTKIRVHGSGHTYFHESIGGNFRIDALQAAVLHIRLRRLEHVTELRRQKAAGYSRRFDQAGLSPNLVHPPTEVCGRHVYHQYVIRAPRRDELAAYLRERQIGCGVYYPLPLHLQPCFRSLGGKRGDFPESERAAQEVLGLPIYPELTDLQQDAVVSAIREFYGSE